MPPTSEQQQERRVKQWQTPITICNNDCHQYKNSSQSANSNSNYTVLYKRPNATATNPLLNCSKLLATLDRELTLEQIIPTNQMEWMEIQRFQVHLCY
jgi:hypothetical protein